MISEERIEKLWEWCGLRVYTDLDLTLSNLYRWAIPLLQEQGYIVELTAMEHSGFECCITHCLVYDPRVEREGVRHEMAEYAVFLAIEKLIEEIG